MHGPRSNSVPAKQKFVGIVTTVKPVQMHNSFSSRSWKLTNHLDRFDCIQKKLDVVSL